LSTIVGGGTVARRKESLMVATHNSLIINLYCKVVDLRDDTTNILNI
jgi:hypothetical protein